MSDSYVKTEQTKARVRIKGRSQEDGRQMIDNRKVGEGRQQWQVNGYVIRSV